MSKGKGRKWTKEEVEFLKSNYGKLTPAEIAKILGRSIGSVDAKRHKLGLKPAFRTSELFDYSYLSETDKAYIAGLFDGEANFSIYRRERGEHFRAGIFVGTTNREAMEKIASLLKVKVHPVPGRGNRRTLWRISIQDVRKLTPLLRAILPYLIIKKKHAELLLKWCELRLTYVFRKRPKGYSEKEREIYLALKHLNTRGVSNEEPGI
jgi:hypothetical protein